MAYMEEKMKILTLGTLFIGSLLSTVYADAAPERMWEEKEIVSSDYEEGLYGFYLDARLDQLLREAKFYHINQKYDLSKKCYEQAGLLAEKLIERDSAYGHDSSHLVAALCFDNSFEEHKPLAKKYYKQLYELVLNHEFKIDDPFDYVFILPILNEGALAAYLYGDEEAFAYLLYKQMELTDPEIFTWFIFYMEELQQLALQKFPKDHWIIEKMETQMHQKVVKEFEKEMGEEMKEWLKLGFLEEGIEEGDFYGLFSLYNPQNGMTPDHVLHYLRNRLPHP